MRQRQKQIDALHWVNTHLKDVTLDNLKLFLLHTGTVASTIQTMLCLYVLTLADSI